ncbi:MAG: DUF4173 domain-containing protein [Caulobacterales bacterium]|nr:DUF4173 domain-containing protein [Caulobacterales bacterium]
MRRGWPSFWIKVALIAALVAVGDGLLFEAEGPGANLGLLTLSWVAGLALANPAILRDRLGRIAVAAAALLALLQIERPSAVGLLLFALAFGVAALAPRGVPDDAWRWAQRLVLAGLKAFWGPFADLRRLRQARQRRGKLKLASLAIAAVLPLAGGAVFLWLFAEANPVIGNGLASLHLGEPDVGRMIFWLALALPVSAALRPRGHRRLLGLPDAASDLALPGVSAGSVTASLVVFNALFALENGLDLAYLWADARLPGRMSFAEYAHRGAYPLMATAVLAGLFVLVFLRPRSPTAASRPVRRLVMVWVAQNLFLVASAALRTVDYIEAYSLTVLRISALLWMLLVAVGLGLIAWRLIAGKSAAWLLNANALAAGIVLAGCSLVDLGAVAAEWNIRHAREVGGAGVPLDLAYMEMLGGAAAVPLAELEQQPLEARFRSEVAGIRSAVVSCMLASQSGWRTWRWRDARRIMRVQALTHEKAALPPAGFYCSDHHD